MNDVFSFVNSNIHFFVVFGTILQIVGTFVLGFFSFYGIKISENKDAYIEGTIMVEIHKGWLLAAKFALLSLLFGIAISAISSLATLDPK